MCGLCGEITFDGSLAQVQAISAMARSMVPGRPDAEGIVARARARLQWLHIKPPRAELEALGYRFFSDGDTEVILKAGHAWGPDAPKRFNSMFAFYLGHPHGRG